MTTSETRPARPKQQRSEGQWALGELEPLNSNEQVKKDDHPLNVRERIETIYPSRVSTASTRPICVAASGGGVCTHSASRVTTAPGRVTTTPTCSRTTTSCCGCVATAAR